MRRAGATDRDGLPLRSKAILLIVVVLLLLVVVELEGVKSMMSAVAVELAVHFALTVGSRV